MNDQISDSASKLLEITARITPQWIAGFFDGEGCVSVYRPQKTGRLFPRVTITQRDPSTLTLIAIMYDGHLDADIPRTTPKGKKTTSSRVVWTGRNCLPFLTAIKDYVVIKKPQVDAAIEMIQYISHQGGDIRGRGGAPDDLEKREVLGQLISHLNERVFNE